MSSKILITGASGLIGSEIIKNLPAEFTWVALSTNRKKCDQKHWFYWNPSKGEINKKALENVDFIIHLAGSSIAQAWTTKNKKEIIDSRVQSTQLLYSYLKNTPNQVKKFISASGIGIYPQADSQIKTEKSGLGNDFPATVCKLWEGEALKMKDLSIDVHIVRTGIVLSNNGGALIPIKTPVEYYIGAPLGNGKQFLSWIHIQDIVNIYMFLINNDKLPEIINGVSPEVVTNKTFTQLVAKVLKKPLLLPNVPSFLLKIALGERSTLVLDGAHVKPTALLNFQFAFQFTELESALQDLLV